MTEKPRDAVVQEAESRALEAQRKLELQLQTTIQQLLHDRPDYARYFQEMVKWEIENPPEDEDDDWSGWVWQKVHTPPSAINSLITWGLVDQMSTSRTYTHYRLHSLSATQMALEALAGISRPEETVAPEDLFSLVVGHDKIKNLLRYAVLADKPVHALLLGPPGTAKTLLLSDIGYLPGAQFYVGSTTTKSGLVGLLLSMKPRYLVIDELDKMTDTDMSPLLNLMETGMVARLQHGARDRITLDTRVFAGANELRRISPAILSRFATFQVPGYSPVDFVNVATQVLVQREGLGPEMSRYVAAQVVPHSTDIRDAIRVARMARGDFKRVKEVVSCLWSGRM